MLRRFRSLFRVLKSRRDFEQGMTEELRFHIEQYTDDLVRSGVPLARSGAARSDRVRQPERRPGRVPRSTRAPPVR